VRKGQHAPATSIHFRHLWGRNKRAELLASSTPGGEALYETIVPANELGLPFMPMQSSVDYAQWPSLPDLFLKSFPGVKTSRDDVVVDIDRDRLVQRMQHYFDPTIGHEEMRRIAPGAMESVAGFDAEAARDRLRTRGFLPANVVPYCYRPFDVRWLYWEPQTKLLDRKREEYVPHVFDGNLWVEARQKQPMEHFDRGYVARVLADNFGNGLSNFFPLYLMPTMKTPELFSPLEPTAADGKEVNLHDTARRYLRDLFGVDDSFTMLQHPAEALFLHAISVLHAPAYRDENRGALRLDWPRVPLPGAKDVLLTSAQLGRHIVALLNEDIPLPQVTAGPLRPELKAIGLLATNDTDEGTDTEALLSITANWGYLSLGGATMPAQGRAIRRDYTSDELASIAEGAAVLGLTAHQALDSLGHETYDIYLNDVAYWRNVPTKVWEYTASGYQVIKKWLSYRERAILRRPLTKNEARTITNMARRVAALLLLGPALDANYESAKQT